jgi:hypothetical protein
MDSWLGPLWTTMAEASRYLMRSYERVSLVHDVFACFIYVIRAFSCLISVVCEIKPRFPTTDEVNVMALAVRYAVTLRALTY